MVFRACAPSALVLTSEGEGLDFSTQMIGADKLKLAGLWLEFHKIVGAME